MNAKIREGAKLPCKGPWHFRRQDSDRRETVTHRGRGEVGELGVRWGVSQSVKVGLQREWEVGGKGKPFDGESGELALRRTAHSPLLHCSFWFNRKPLFLSAVFQLTGLPFLEIAADTG